jgi:hypothetical protein
MTASLYASKNKKNYQNDNDEAQAAAAVITGPVKWTAAEAAKASKQNDNEDYEKDQAHVEQHAKVASVPSLHTVGGASM